MSSSAEVTLREKAYTIIQRKLLKGEILAGDLVSELSLSDDMGIGRTPVREAIIQMEREGLFDKVRRVGTLVKFPNQDELRELYTVREALESHAAATAAIVLSAKNLALMNQLNQELVELVEESRARKLEVLDEALLRRYFDIDIALHAVIVGSVNSEKTSRIVNEFRVAHCVFEFSCMAYLVDVVDQVTRQHGEILKAIERGDSDRARSAMVTHIRSASEHALDRFTSSEVAKKKLLASSGATAVNSPQKHSRIKQRSRQRKSVLASED
ncbi:GntR family transcriptional regulator [bacterium]|nr:MAG: GntR family transcriptional regulator [bacterium]